MNDIIIIYFIFTNKADMLNWITEMNAKIFKGFSYDRIICICLFEQ